MIRPCLLVLFTSVLACLAQELPTTASSRDRAEMAETFVHQRLTVWQQRLHLEAWKISVVMSRRSDMKPRKLGAIRWDKHRKTAEMQVLDASEYQLPLAGMLADMEFTVVHELIHLELASLPRSEASRSDEEHAVNQMAKSLLDLVREADSQSASSAAAGQVCSHP